MNAVDIVFGLQTPETVRSRPEWSTAFFAERFGTQGGSLTGMSVAAHLELMDEAGVDHALLFAPKAGPEYHPASYRADPAHVAKTVEKHPERFSGIIGVDPLDPMKALAEIEFAITSMGFIGVHAYPHWFGLAPNDPLWYPIYSKCCELDVPIQMQLGHCLLYTTSLPLQSVGRPLTVDQIACHFPDLKFIGIHTGWPWTEEMISVAWKHPNVYIGTDAYAPKHWPPSLVRFIDSWGSDSVLFGTDFPVIDPRRAMREIRQLEIRPDSLDKFLSSNARRLYGLDSR